MQIWFCFESRFENSNFHFSCLLVVLIIELCFYMGLLQFALGLSKFKGESPKDSYSAKQRENHAGQLFFMRNPYTCVSYMKFQD